MNFRPRQTSEPEINLIPFIDVLLVILIFLMLSSTYSHLTELQVKLPTADADKTREYPKQLHVTVSADGQYAIDKVPLAGKGMDSLSSALRAAATAGKDTVVTISADAQAAHQSVITVLEAARAAGLPLITFATQSNSVAPNPSK